MNCHPGIWRLHSGRDLQADHIRRVRHLVRRGLDQGTCRRVQRREWDRTEGVVDLIGEPIIQAAIAFDLLQSLSDLAVKSAICNHVECQENL